MSSGATVSGTNIPTETRSNTPLSCLSAQTTVRPSNSITKKPKVWIALLRSSFGPRLFQHLSFRPPVFRPASSRLKDEASPSKANLPSIVSRSSEHAPDALPSSRNLERPTIESDPSCQLTTRSELLAWRGRSHHCVRWALASWLHSAFSKDFRF